jgi:hypothetical protein
MLRVLSLVGAILFVLATRPSLSEAQIYRWVDDRGVPHYSEGIDSIPARFRKTAVPLELRNAPVSPSGPAPAGVEAAGATTPPGATTIRVKFVKGYGFIVDATVNGTTAAKLIADTGAERTQITPRVLTAAGVLPAKEPSGTPSAPTTVQIASLAVGGLRVEKLSVGVVSPIDDRENVDGLLGRDFLDRFQVLIDTDNGIATLSPKSQ